MNNLIHISKPGEPKLKIHADALAQHIKLGWQHCEADPVPANDSKANVRNDADDKPKVRQ